MKKAFQYLFRVVYIVLLPLLALYLIVKARNFDDAFASDYGFAIALVAMFVFLLFNSFVIYNKVLTSIKLKPTLPSWIEFGPIVGFAFGWSDKAVYLILPFVVITIEWKK
mgnify:CR=1 FL=1